ncbi:MAG TPA: DUF3019 domain-containing protein [Cellvibrio sp.]|nr:DUF3019 domain-containing protein [Cellvibrio sp.]
MKNKYQFIAAVWFFSMAQSSIANEQEKNSITLSLKPKECVVLKEGDKCYASVKIKWSSKNARAICLYRTPDQIQLECWESVNEGQFTEDLVMVEPVEYYLIPTNGSEILTSETVNLSWVHGKSNRPEHTWRLF